MDSSFSFNPRESINTPIPASRHSTTTSRSQLAQSHAAPAQSSSSSAAGASSALLFGNSSNVNKSVRFDTSVSSTSAGLPTYSTPSRAAASSSLLSSPSPASSSLFRPNQSASRYTSSPSSSSNSTALSPRRSLPSPIALLAKAPLVDQAVQQVKGTVPRGRAELVRRLKVNGAICMAWYFVGQTPYYRAIADSLVHQIPSLDSLLSFIEGATSLLLLYNILDAIYSLSKRRALVALTPPASINAMSPQQQRLSGSHTTGLGSPSTFTRVLRSSPKTRPSPLHTSPSSIVSRMSPQQQQQQQQQQSPSTSYALRSGAATTPNPLLSTATSPSSTSLSASTSRRRSVLSNSVGEGGIEETANSTLNAYVIRHSPIASNLHKSISDRASIDRLLTQLQ